MRRASASVLPVLHFVTKNGIVQVDKSRCIGCDYCVCRLPFHVRYLNPQTGIADKCNFCADTRTEVGQSPMRFRLSDGCAEFGRRDDPEIQHWINQNGLSPAGYA